MCIYNPVGNVFLGVLFHGDKLKNRARSDSYAIGVKVEAVDMLGVGGGPPPDETVRSSESQLEGLTKRPVLCALDHSLFISEHIFSICNCDRDLGTTIDVCHHHPAPPSLLNCRCSRAKSYTSLSFSSRISAGKATQA